jgi:DNA helicase-2/ATP-dependent DNA helicase PcrA
MRIDYRHVYASRTRFIPEALLAVFDLTSWPVVTADSAHSGARPKH